MAKTLVYQMYPLSYQNIGAMIRHLLLVSRLGVDYVWLNPLYLSPRHDHGYDVSSYRAIDPRFGTMRDFEEFVRIAHSYGIGVLMDLVLNHTSTEHSWFENNPEYYCWSKAHKPGWKNLFNEGSCWQYNAKQGEYYLHLFQETQADLNWFPDGKNINKKLVKEFDQIVSYWEGFNIDGFRLDVPQAINKNLESDTLDLQDMFFGYKSAEVIKTVFKNHSNLFLMMECFDPSFGGLTEYYDKNTQVDFILNMLVKKTAQEGLQELDKVIKASVKNPRFMLDLESHDSPRFPSVTGLTPKESIELLFSSDAEGICLYQGQELGMLNPTPLEMTTKQMLHMDAEMLMRFRNGEDPEELRKYSRANARAPMDDVDHVSEITDTGSLAYYTKTWIDKWRG